MKKRKNKKGFLIGGIAAGAVVILAGGGILAWKLLINTATPQETVKNYFALVEKGQYDKMYAMLSERTRETVSEKEFTERNQNIYEGIEAKDIKCLLSKLKTLDFTDFCPIFWYNDCKDFDKNKSFFLQFSYRF